MMKECPFSSRSKCDIWVDYQVACAALQEAEYKVILKYVQ